MIEQSKNQYHPESVSPPGETLADLLEERGMSQAELAERTGRPTKTINEIIKDKAMITPETAIQLERVFGVPAEFWNSREALYRFFLNVQYSEEEKLTQGRFPANLVFSQSETCTDEKCADECAVKMLDEQSGILKQGLAGKKSRPFGGQGIYGHCKEFKPNETETYKCDQPSGASRFFYCAKVSPSERNAGLEQKNNHPTVKAQKLMRYLCRLITPPQGVVLDPFMGSGSTGLAAIAEGFEFIGIEKEADYFEIAQARIKNGAGRD